MKRQKLSLGLWNPPPKCHAFMVNPFMVIEKKFTKHSKEGKLGSRTDVVQPKNGSDWVLIPEPMGSAGTS